MLYSKVLRHLDTIGKYIANKLTYVDENSIKCDKCKGRMVLKMKNLYLLPCKFGDTHLESADYYKNNTSLIVSAEQIPTGQRSAFMSLFCCEDCGNKMVSVIDFLKIRNDTMAKGGTCFSYSEIGSKVEADFYEARQQLSLEYMPGNSAYSYYDKEFEN